MPQQDNPFETPSPKGIRLVQATLRVVIAIQCWGYAAGYLHLQRPFVFLEMLQTGYDLPAEKMVLFGNYAAYFLIGYGVVTLFRPMWLVLVPLAVWQTGMAISAAVLEQGSLPYLGVAEQTVRFVVPTALLLIDFWPPRVKPTLSFCLISVGMLRFAVMVTLFAHGLIALHNFQNGGELVELLTRMVQNLFEKTVDANQAQQALAVIGIIDIAVALALISSRNRVIAFWIVLWGLMNAASYTFAYGVKGYDQTLIRIAESGAPLAILFFWLTAIREQKPVIVPEGE